MVRLLPGNFSKVDGSVFEDFEVTTIGPITALPKITGVGGCVLEAGGFTPRQ